MSQVFDYNTADNAEVPHVRIYHVDTDITVALVYIENGNISIAEHIAANIVNDLNVIVS